MSKPKVQFIIPTLNRTEFLKLAIDSVLSQTVEVDRIFVGIKKEDVASHKLVESYGKGDLIRKIEARGVGVIGSMSSCLAEADGEFVALIDDDVELPEIWLERMLGHLENHGDVVGCSGRDLLQDYPEMRRSEHLTLDVGHIYWYGRITGNHHRGGGAPRVVQILRGSNILFRGEFLRSAGFEQKLRGKGAQVNWELALAFQAAAAGKNLFFDPTMGIIHHTAPRQDMDLVHRGIFVAEGIKDMSFNETYVTKAHAPLKLRVAAILWQFVVGTRSAPGLINTIRRILLKEPPAVESAVAAVKGRVSALLR